MAYSEELVKAISTAEKIMRNKFLNENEDIDKLSQDTSEKQAESSAPSIQVDSLKILDFIKEGRVEAHLIGVYKQTTDSELHQNYLKDELDKKVNNFGPIVEETDQDQLFSYCKNIFNSNFPKDEMLIQNYVDYILSVWVPEVMSTIYLINDY